MDSPLTTAPSSSTAPRARPERRSRARRTLTCENCRARKTRCDGTQPSCKTCEVYHDECRYEKPPPMSQIIAMANRLQEAEQTILKLKKALETEPSPVYHPTTANQSVSPASEGHLGHPGNSTQHRARSSSTEPTSEELLADLSRDEHGKISYYGPTSAIYEPAELDPPSADIQSYDELPSKTNIRTLLTWNAEEYRSWEEFALGNAAIETSIPRATMSKLLQIHWAWIAPMFMWVYRPAFMRDMTTGGPYYTPFLLTVLCAHAARFHERPIGEMLICRARLLLGSEIQKPSTIPTVQALLQLSAREMAYGSTSQAWLYSGMAFRMVSDLGLHHNSGKILHLGYLSPEELEIRRRLFWSCYFWDKAISLYLGRSPVLLELPFDHTPEFLDTSAENEVWSPYHGETLNLSRVSVGEYPPMKAHLISCFENSCKLSVILNDILIELYSRRGSPDLGKTLQIKRKLDEWRENLPEHLKYDPQNLPAHCPPPHIMTQNLLYHTTIILLHRPFWSASEHHIACRKAADNLERLLLLLGDTFGFNRITYLMSYCIYTAASVMIKDVKAGDLEANRKMQTFLRALQQGTTTCPLIQRSLDIINNSLQPKTPRLASLNDIATTENIADANHLPAFPYPDLDVANQFTADRNPTGMDLDAFSLLDSFPEQHINTATGEWYFG
ncbi:fungal-specific transcription factor domain-containing protein [Aspergillus cavernicola]|uniref:Fungal-specific transcription factor domain-containing protein n=1 Tax=Aspergillus cavernicola TaxID=176166 RepID=A0ABR4HIS3_9EURO